MRGARYLAQKQFIVYESLLRNFLRGKLSKSALDNLVPVTFGNKNNQKEAFHNKFLEAYFNATCCNAAAPPPSVNARSPNITAQINSTKPWQAKKWAKVICTDPDPTDFTGSNRSSLPDAILSLSKQSQKEEKDKHLKMSAGCWGRIFPSLHTKQHQKDATRKRRYTAGQSCNSNFPELAINRIANRTRVLRKDRVPMGLPVQSAEQAVAETRGESPIVEAVCRILLENGFSDIGRPGVHAQNLMPLNIVLDNIPAEVQATYLLEIDKEIEKETLALAREFREASERLKIFRECSLKSK